MLTTAAEDVTRLLSGRDTGASVRRLQPGQDPAAVLAEEQFDLVLAEPSSSTDRLLAWLARRGDQAPPVLLVGEPAREPVPDAPSLYVETVPTDLHTLVAALRRVEVVLRERQRRTVAERLAEAVAAGIAEGLLIVGGGGSVESANAAAADLLGLPSAALRGRSLHPLVHARSDGSFRCAGSDCWLAPIALGRSSTPVREEVVLRGDGTEVPVTAAVRPIGRGGEPPWLLFLRERSEVRRLEQELAQRATTDPLTGLTNSTHFRRRLSDALLRATRTSRRVALLFIDIDRFHVVNAGLGHAAGDQLLRDIGLRIAARLGTERVVARFGGDQFTVLIENIRRGQEAVKLAEHLTEELRAPFLVDGQEVFVTASIGIAVSPDSGGHPADLLREADAALHMAKASGRGRYVLGTDRPPDRQPRIELETDLWRALQRGELRLEYQPIVRLDGGAIVQFEALARWDHPVHGTLMPATFVPLAEEMGLMVSLGRWVLEEACRQASAWSGRGGRVGPPGVSVNLSAEEFRRPDLARQVAGVLSRTGLDPAALTLEITENTLMTGVTDVVKVLRGLKRLGARLAIDDFGTGYSSLSYLLQFPVDAVKIDKSLVRPLRTGRRRSAIVRAVVNLAHDLDMTVTAEGVETKTQIDCLRDARCDYGQGFYFAPPLPADDVAGFLQSTTAGGG